MHIFTWHCLSCLIEHDTMYFNSHIRNINIYIYMYIPVITHTLPVRHDVYTSYGNNEC